jgi:hypothetical protein
MSDIRELLHDAAEHPGELDLERVQRDGRRRQRRPLKIAGAVFAVVVIAALVTVRVADDDQHSAPVIAPPPTETPVTTTPPTATTTAAQGAAEAAAKAAAAVAAAKATAAAPGPLDSFRLGYEGLGPIKLGMTLSEASAAAGMTIALPPSPDCGSTSPNLVAYALTPDGKRLLLLWFMVRDGTIIEIATTNPNISTISGIHTGSTLADVLRTYPNAQIGSGQQGNTEAHIVDARGRQIAFAVQSYDTDPGAPLIYISLGVDAAAVGAGARTC